MSDIRTGAGGRATDHLHAAEMQYLFPVPMISIRWPDSGALNAELRRVILAREKGGAGVKISNIGGWHSEKDLHRWPAPCIAPLLERMHALVRELVRRTVPAPQREHLSDWRLWAWANVNRRGHYNESHRHQPPYLWAGIYYVDPGDPDPITGRTRLQDLSGVPKEVVNDPDPFEREVEIVPEAGLMVLLPVTAWHYVEPYRGERPRITVGFDFANPAFTIPTYGSAARNWWQTHFPWLMRGKQLLERRLGVRRPLR